MSRKKVKKNEKNDFFYKKSTNSAQIEHKPSTLQAQDRIKLAQTEHTASTRLYQTSTNGHITCIQVE